MPEYIQKQSVRRPQVRYLQQAHFGAVPGSQYSHGGTNFVDAVHRIPHGVHSCQGAKPFGHQAEVPCGECRNPRGCIQKHLRTGMLLAPVKHSSVAWLEMKVEGSKEGTKEGISVE